MKKLLIMLLCLLLCATLPAWAEEVETERETYVSGDYYYALLKDGAAEIVTYTGSAEALEIPDALDGHSVTAIGDRAFSGCTSLTSVAIPDGVTSIGNTTFSDCTSLTSVTIPDSVTSIGKEAFSDCYSLTSITIPDSVTSIGWGAFSGCNNLTLTVGQDSYAMEYCVKNGLPTSAAETVEEAVEVLVEIYVSGDYKYALLEDGTAEIDRYTGSAEALEIPDVLDGHSVTAIGDSAFSDCESLTSVIIPDSVTAIGDRAFYYCFSLTSITIPDSVTAIGDYAFGSCDNLTLTVGRESYAREYCVENGLSFIYPDTYDWLNE